MKTLGYQPATPSGVSATTSRESWAMLVRTISALLLAFFLQPSTARACAACYGQSDSPMAQGMNWGIFSLLGIIILVLGGIAAFFVHLARRQEVHTDSAPLPDSSSAGPHRTELQPQET